MCEKVACHQSDKTQTSDVATRGRPPGEIIPPPLSVAVLTVTIITDCSNPSTTIYSSKLEGTHLGFHSVIDAMQVEHHVLQKISFLGLIKRDYNISNGSIIVCTLLMT
jgi:hypothetical protein